MPYYLYEGAEPMKNYYYCCSSCKNEYVFIGALNATQLDCDGGNEKKGCGKKNSLVAIKNEVRE